MDSIFVSFGDLCDKIEVKILNPVGYIPVVNNLSTGPMRFVLSFIQFNVGLVGAIYHGLSSAFSSGEKQTEHQTLAGYSFELIVHSFANVFRAGSESISLIGSIVGALLSTKLIIATTLVPPLVNFAYDSAGYRYSYSKI